MSTRRKNSYGATAKRRPGLLRSPDEQRVLRSHQDLSQLEQQEAAIIDRSELYQSDTHLHRYHHHNAPYRFNDSVNLVRQDVMGQSITLIPESVVAATVQPSNQDVEIRDESEPEDDQVSLLSYEHNAQAIMSQALCHCSYIVEPMAFIQNLASAIVNISLGQFIYNRILTRLIDQATGGGSPNTTNSSLPSFYSFGNASNGSVCAQQDPGNNGSKLLASSIMSSLSTTFSASSYMLAQLPFQPFIEPIYEPHRMLQGKLTPDDYQRIRTQAQEETADLYFMSSLCIGIPVILMTNLLGVNCSTLGRKTLMLVFLIAMTIKFSLLFLQSVYTDWPDWVFYVGAFIEGCSGSSGVFYLSLYCFISDYTSPGSRSYRITFINYLNSAATLCVTFACGYVIKYYGYTYLFLTSSILMAISLVYTALFIPEPLAQLQEKTLWQRLRSCSIKKTVNCFTVYFSEENEQRRHKRRQDTEETENLLNGEENEDAIPRVSKQTFVLLLIVFANFIYNFGTIGIASIFSLYIMNEPFCFDSIEISHYVVFATLVSLVASLFVSKLFKVNDVLICILSVASYFASVFCYIFGNTSFYIYVGAVVASLSGLEYGYARSIVSKSVEKHEVGDALSLILIVDTIIAVVSSILFPILYSRIVSTGLSFLFSFSNGFVLMAMICHM